MRAAQGGCRRDISAIVARSYPITPPWSTVRLYVQTQTETITRRAATATKQMDKTDERPDELGPWHRARRAPGKKHQRRANDMASQSRTTCQGPCPHCACV